MSTAASARSGGCSSARSRAWRTRGSTPGSASFCLKAAASGRTREPAQQTCVHWVYLKASRSAAVSNRISKSKFVAGCQCLKRLYLQVHEPDLAAEPDGASEAVIEQGREVGLLARQMFPGGVE